MKFEDFRNIDDKNIYHSRNLLMKFEVKVRFSRFFIYHSRNLLMKFEPPNKKFFRLSTTVEIY